MKKDQIKKLESTVRRKYLKLGDLFDEKVRRLWAASEAEAIGHGGIAIVHNATKLAVSTIRIGIEELMAKKEVPIGKKKTPCKKKRIRKKGGGRKKITKTNPNLEKEIKNLVNSGTKGNPEKAILWTNKALRTLKKELKKGGTNVSIATIARILRNLGYKLRANNKCLETKGDHPDRDAQFEHINNEVNATMKKGNPVISVDTKKKEHIGNYNNNGKEWCSEAPKVLDHDFPNGKHAHPYGIYDLARNEGFVNIGTDHDTAQFAVASIACWWKQRGRKLYPNATSILITADSGGSNSNRAHLWKTELQKVANETGLIIKVCHFPAGTSKWNKVEHRLFSFISIHWRSRPLVSYKTIVNLIRETTTEEGLKVDCKLDENKYPTGIKISKEEFESINLVKDEFHGEWNYSILPQEK